MPPSGRASLGLESLRVAVLYTVCTLVLAYPLTWDPAGSALPMGADTDLMVWAIGWDVHALTHAPLSLFDANIFHPQRRTLAYSENFIGSAILAAPIVWLTGNVVLAMNVVALLSCILCGVGTYVLCRRVGVGPLGAALGGLIFAFAPPRFFRLGQLFLTTIQWVPFALASLHAYLDFGRRRDLWWACAFFTLQVLTSGHGAVFATIGIGALLIWRAALGEPLTPLKRLRDLGVPGAVLLAIGATVLLPYLAVQEEMGLRRSLREAYTWSPNLASFLASPTRVHAFLLSRLSDTPILQDAKAFLFPGYLTLGLALACLWPRFGGASDGSTPVPAETGPHARPARMTWIWLAWLIEIALLVCIVTAIVVTLRGGVRLRVGGTTVFSARQPWRVWFDLAILMALRLALLRRVPFAPGERLRRFRDRLRGWSETHRRSAPAFYGVLSAISLWLSLGPPFALYTFVYSWPGFSFIRVPSRFTLVTLLALSVLGAAGFERLTTSLGRRTRVAVAVLAAAVLVVEFSAIPLNAVPYTVDIPPIDRWLATQPKPFVVAELPMASPADVGAWERRQSVYMLHSMAHWQKIHGYSGMRPGLHTALYSALTRFPDDNSLIGLTDLGVTYVVVHTDWYPPHDWAKVDVRLEHYKAWLTLEQTAGADRVYSIERPAADVLLRARFDQYIAAVTQGDAALAAGFYADDALVVRPQGRILRGRAAIADWITTTFEEPGPLLALDVRDLVVEGAEARIEGRFRTRDGRVAVQRGQFLQVWKLSGGQWKLASDLFSAEQTQTPSH